MTPDQVAPPWAWLGKRPTRPVAMSRMGLASSLASLSHTPVRSRDLSFFTSCGRSHDRKITSNSISVPSGKRRRNMLDGGMSIFTLAPDQSCHVLIVVVFSSG